MRDYAKVAPQFWTGRTGRQLRQLGPEAQLLALYLVTCPSANMLGLYYLPLPTLCHETGSPMEGACKALRSLDGIGFAHYDSEAEQVWVPEMARFQLGDALKAGDKRIAGVARELSTLTSSVFYAHFVSRYNKPFRLGLEALEPKPLPSPFQAPPKPGAGTRERTGTETGAGGSAEGGGLVAGKPAPPLEGDSGLGDFGLGEVKSGGETGEWSPPLEPPPPVSRARPRVVAEDFSEVDLSPYPGLDTPSFRAAWRARMQERREMGAKGRQTESQVAAQLRQLGRVALARGEPGAVECLEQATAGHWQGVVRTRDLAPPNGNGKYRAPPMGSSPKSRADAEADQAALGDW
jgi:hypothetical protein